MDPWYERMTFCSTFSWICTISQYFYHFSSKISDQFTYKHVSIVTLNFSGIFPKIQKLLYSLSYYSRNVTFCIILPAYA